MLEKTAGMNGTYILMYTSSMMFVLRHFAGPIAHRLSPVGMLTGRRCSRPSACILLSFAYDFKTRDRRGDDLRTGHRLLLADDARRDGRAVPARRGLPAGADGVHRQSGGRHGPALDGPNQRSDHVRGHPRRRCRTRILVGQAIDPGKLKQLPPEEQEVRHRGSEGRGEVVVPVRLRPCRSSWSSSSEESRFPTGYGAATNRSS